MKLHCLFLSLFVLHMPSLSLANGYSVTRIEPSTVVFKGEIDDRTAAELLAAIRQPTKKLIVTSPGGDFVKGLEIAHEIRRRRIEVIVDRYCVSSCANYLFLGARKKSLLPGSFIGFHGALSSMLSARQKKELRSQSREDVATLDGLFDEYARHELNFLAEIKVDSALFKHVHHRTSAMLKLKGRDNKGTVAGGYTVRAAQQEHHFKIGEESQVDQLIKQLERDEIKFTAEGELKMVSGGDLSDIAYFPSIAILRRYGVTGIGQYAYPKSGEELNDLVRTHMKAVTVMGDFSDTSRPPID